jgi:SpoVK/Ycf46/Vps4 family AAA+-type ATPase
MLSDDKLQSHAILKGVEESESSANDRFKDLQARLEDIRASLASEELRSRALQDQEMRTYLEKKLDVPQSRDDLRLESPEYILKSSGNWIFSNPDYYSWETDSPPEGSVLFLNGSPGSGKHMGFHSTCPQLTSTPSK